MYIVVSRWRIKPGQDDEFDKRGRDIRNMLRSTPGIKLMEGFKSEDGSIIAILGYEDEATYHRVIDDANGPFARALAATKLEEVSEWVSSDRGEAVVDD